MTRIQGRTFVNSVLDNLEVYRTGTLRRGVIDGGELTIEDCIPSGGWATEADFKRIGAYRAGVIERQHSNVSLPWVGVKGAWNGEDIRLDLYSARDEAKREVRRYGARLDVAWREARRPPEHLPIPVPLFESSVSTPCSTLQSAASCSSPALPPATRLRWRRPAELVRAEASLQKSQRAAAAIEQQMEEVDDDGAPVLTGKLLANTAERYEKHGEQIDQHRVRVTELSEEIARMEAEASTVPCRGT